MTYYIALRLNNKDSVTLYTELKIVTPKTCALYLASVEIYLPYNYTNLQSGGYVHMAHALLVTQSGQVPTNTHIISTFPQNVLFSSESIRKHKNVGELMRNNW